jgi:hypothetical protein
MRLFKGWQEIPAKSGPIIHRGKLLVGYGSTAWHAEFGRAKPAGLGKFTATVQAWRIYGASIAYVAELRGARGIDIIIDAERDPLETIEQWIVDRIRSADAPDSDLNILFGNMTDTRWPDYLAQIERDIREYRDPVLRLITKARRAEKQREKLNETARREMELSGLVHQIRALQTVLNRALPNLSNIVSFEYTCHGSRPRAEFDYENTRWTFIPVNLLDPIDPNNNTDAVIGVYGNYTDRPVEFAQCMYDMSVSDGDKFERKLLESMGRLLAKA